MPGNRRLLVAAGAALFLIGGAILAFGADRPGTAVGTTVALAGIVLLGWTWLSRGKGDR